jgi:hypothetical protein
MATTRGPTLTTAMRVVDGVHGHAANCWTNTPPALRTCLAQGLQAVLAVAHLTNRGAALGVRTNMKAMLNLGWRHVAVIVAETLFLLGLAWAAVSIGIVGI